MTLHPTPMSLDNQFGYIFLFHFLFTYCNIISQEIGNTIKSEYRKPNQSFNTIPAAGEILTSLLFSILRSSPFFPKIIFLCYVLLCFVLKIYVKNTKLKRTAQCFLHAAHTYSYLCNNYPDKDIKHNRILHACFQSIVPKGNHDFAQLNLSFLLFLTFISYLENHTSPPQYFL